MIEVFVKRCPSFIEWFGQGFVLKMWSDVILRNDGINGDGILQIVDLVGIGILLINLKTFYHMTKLM